MNNQVAAEIVALMRECSDKLNVSVQRVKDTCSEDVFWEYRKTIGTIMASMYLDVMLPIFKEHPELEPETMKPKQ